MVAHHQAGTLTDVDGRTLTSCVRTIVAGIHGRCPDVVRTLTSCVLHSLHAIKLRAKPFLKTAAPSGLERKRGATAAPETTLPCFALELRPCEVGSDVDRTEGDEEGDEGDEGRAAGYGP